MSAVFAAASNECNVYVDSRSDYPGDSDTDWFVQQDGQDYIYDITGCTLVPTCSYQTKARTQYRGAMKGVVTSISLNGQEVPITTPNLCALACQLVRITKEL